MMTNGELKIAIVGSGRMGLQHARVVDAQKGSVRLNALIDPSTASREEASKQFPGVQTFASLAEAATRVPIEAVHVCTPQLSHFAVADEALRHGCHVLVEKPFTSSLEEATELFERARSRDLSVCAGHQLLFEPAYRRLCEQLPLVNSVVHIESYFAFAPTAGTPSGRAGLDPESQLVDILPHPLYLLLDAMKRAAPGGSLEVCDARLGDGGTFHALLRRGGVHGTLVVTISGRPVESTLRVVGTGGELCADLVRGILRQQLGPGRSAIDKIAAPYTQALQGTLGTTGVLLRRFLGRKRDYPSLDELIMRWHSSIREGRESPTPEEDVLVATGVFESILDRNGLGTVREAPVEVHPNGRPLVVVTGGTGWLGSAVTRKLTSAGARVAVISRRGPASWQRQLGVEYASVDLAEEASLDRFSDAVCVVHCAAETSGGQTAHARNSVKATAELLTGMRRAGIGRLVHVSSLAVLDPERGAISEETPLHTDPAAFGPYTWGKAESEKLVRAAEDIDSRIVRPAAIVDASAFDPPGKLGRRVGPIFVAVGGRNEHLGVVDLDWTARAIAWMALHFDEAPETINLLDPVLPTRRELVGRLGASNPTLIKLRMPRPVLWLSGLILLGLSRVLRPGKTPVDIRKVFARQRFDTRASAELQEMVTRSLQGSPTVPPSIDPVGGIEAVRARAEGGRSIPRARALGRTVAQADTSN